MTWIQKLCETYDNCSDSVLKAESLDDLLPICHTTVYSQIEITIDSEGEFQKAANVTEDDKLTIIPCTEDSANRTSGLSPHPLFDVLKYIAGDYTKYVDSKDDGFPLYITQLEKWVNSPYSNSRILAIYKYLKKGTVIADLVKENILFVGENGKLSENGENKSESSSKSFVRFRVDSPEFPNPQTWNDEQVRRDFIEYYQSTLGNKELCYVTGEILPCSEKISGKIRNPGDSAKIISSNDMQNFTFKGRAETPNQAVSISYISSQKCINALKWLIQKQGYKSQEQAIVAWGTRNEKIPSIRMDDNFNDFDDEDTSNERIDTRDEYAGRLNSAIRGYAKNLSESSNVVVIGLDSPSFKGRLSITFYRELDGIEFLKRMKHWYNSVSWYPLSFTTYDSNKKPHNHLIYGTPTPIEIASAAYGRKLDDKLKKSVVERLLPCIIDGIPIPYELVNQLTERSSRPTSMETYEWKKTIGITCAIIRKYYNDKNNRNYRLNDEYNEIWKVELNMNETDRNYLFGRALAYARRIEEYAFYVSETAPRQTNAERFMTQFKKHPVKTWGELYQKLLPYLSRFRTSSPTSLGNRYEAEMNAVIDKLNESNGFTNESLSPVYLLGYQSQLNVFNKEIQEMKEKKMNETKGE